MERVETNIYHRDVGWNASVSNQTSAVPKVSELFEQGPLIFAQILSMKIVQLGRNRKD